MPTLPIRGRGLRRRGNSHDLRVQPNGTNRRRVKPPPRVESTQPRDTSPEPSSGEETAGEERFVDQFVSRENEVWVDGDGVDAEEGEWVDEDDEVEDDLLQLEYHPTYVSRADKRRRRWETRWDTLVQAVSTHDTHSILEPSVICLFSLVPSVGSGNRYHYGPSRCACSHDQIARDDITLHQA